MKIINGKQMPEVGDVWANRYIENKIVHVFGIYQNGFGTYVCYGDYYPRDMEVICGKASLDFFLEDYNYLGKSKANIKELFEVQNAKNCSVEPKEE